MITPNNRKEFERNIFLLIERIRMGKLHLPPDKSLMRSLVNMKRLPNKRVAFHSINESARLMANSTANFDRPEFKNRKDAKQ